MRWWSNKYLLLLFVFSLLIQASYGQEVNQTLNDTNQPQKIGIGFSPTITTQNITIDLNSTNNLPVKETTVEVFDNGTKILDLYTNDNGLAFFQADQSKTYSFVIEAESYENVTKNITILPGILDNKIKFTLKPLKSQNDSDFWPLFVPAVIGFIAFMYWFHRFYYSRNIPDSRWRNILFTIFLFLLILSWPVVLIYLRLQGKVNILLPGILTPDNVSFPVYIPVLALIGVISYLLRSIEETFLQIIPRYKKKSIIWGYIRRITIAPYIAILGIYILLDAAKVQNIWFIYGFSFFTGMFTKTIEEWLYKSIQGSLPENLMQEIKEREKYNIENSELVVRLKVDEDVANSLYENGIREVDQLALLDINRLDKCIKEYLKIEKGIKIWLLSKLRNRPLDKVDELVCPDIKILKTIKKEINPEYLNKIIKDAQNQIAELDKLKELLNLTTFELDLLIDNAKVYSITDFVDLDIDSIDWGMKPSENAKIIQTLKQKQIQAKAIVSPKT